MRDTVKDPITLDEQIKAVIYALCAWGEKHPDYVDDITSMALKQVIQNLEGIKNATS